MMAVFAFVLATAVPNPALTPPDVRPLSLKEVCTTKWGTDSRHVKAAWRRALLEAAGNPDPTSVVVDHVIPRELAGADAPENLQLQTWAESKRKDKDENRLHRAVCKGQMSLAAAQDEMRKWGR